MCVHWMACPLAIMTLVLLPLAASESSDFLTATEPQCSLSRSDALEQVLRLIQEEQSVTDIDSSEEQSVISTEPTRSW